MATSTTDNSRNLEILEKLTNEYKNQCRDTPWENSIKKGLDETVSAIKRAKGEVASQFEKVSKIAATTLDLEKKLEAKKQELMADFQKKVQVSIFSFYLFWSMLSSTLM